MTITEAPLVIEPVEQPIRKSLLGKKATRRIGLTSLQIIMTLILLTFLLPTLWMISSSLKVSNEVFAHPIVWIPKDPQWKNYTKLFTIPPFNIFSTISNTSPKWLQERLKAPPLSSLEKVWNQPLMPKVILNTLIVTGMAVLGTIVSSFSTGYAFARLRWPGKNFWFALMIATMLLPEVITLLPRFLIFRDLGWIDTFKPLIVPYWLGATTLYIFLVVQFLRGLPLELEEAALIDGANRFQIMTQIILPLAKPVIATIAVFAVIQHYNSFLEPMIYLNSMDNWTLAIAIRAINDSNVQNWELVFSAGTLMLVPVLILFVIAQRYFVQGIAMTGFGGR